jgi:hypothetical protein
MRDFAAPTTKCATSETVAATITAGIPAIKKKGMIGINAPMAVDKAPETAETIGLLNPSAVVLRRGAPNPKNPISNQSNVRLPQAAQAKQPATAPTKSPKTDSVQLSLQAKVALAGGDVDHDGDAS